MYILDALTLLRGKYLEPKYRSKWTGDNPALGYCYIVCEAFFHYSDEPLEAYRISLGEFGTHWFLKRADGTIVDPTRSQFTFEIDYSQGQKSNYLKDMGTVETSRGRISKRGYQMASYLHRVHVLNNGPAEESTRPD